jgi:hypothetical protein
VTVFFYSLLVCVVSIVSISVWIHVNSMEADFALKKGKRNDNNNRRPIKK